MMNLGLFLLWIGAIGMTVPQGYDGPPLLRDSQRIRPRYRIESLA